MNSPLFQFSFFLVYFFGDPYIGSNREEVKRKNAGTAEVEADVRKLKAEFDCNNNSGRDFNKAETPEGKRKRYHMSHVTCHVSCVMAF